MSMTEDSNSIAHTILKAASVHAVRPGSAEDAIDGIVPQVVVSPRNTNELSRMLSFANEEGLAVAPRGGGTQLSIGNRMRRLDAVVDMSRLNRVLEHNAADLTLVVEAGITLASLRTVLAVEGQFLPLDAPLVERATIGGTLAAGVSGPLKWQYGSARDLVIGMKVAQADGRITQSGGNVVKNVSGYDMARLHVGGLGTLGIITEVSFKLTPIPRHETTLLAQFDTVQDCLGAALGIFNSGVMPIALTAFNGNAAGRVRHMDEVSGEFALAVRLGGRPRTLRRMENEAFFVIRERTDRVDRLEDEAEELWSELADIGYSEGEKAMVSARVATLPNRLNKAIDAFASRGNATIVGQPGYGMINAHWFGESRPSAGAIHGMRQDLQSIDGSLIVERAPHQMKATLDVWDYAGDSIDTMRRLKAQYDPNGILNPNRFAGGI